MKIGIIGPGAIGCLFAGRLHSSGEDITLLDNNPARAELISKRGVQIDGEIMRVPITANPKTVKVLELLMFCVKAYDTESAAEEYSRIILRDNPMVLTLQNGVENTTLLKECARELYAGTTCEAANLIGMGKIEHTGRGETIICGEKPGRIINVLNSAGFDAREANNLEELLWSKLVLNSGINSVTAVYGVSNGELIDRPYLKNLLTNIINESWQVAKQKGLRILYENPVEKAYEVCERTRHNKSSMLQDVLRGKRTEIDCINGIIIKTGKEMGVETPLNKELYAKIKMKEEATQLLSWR